MNKAEQSPEEKQEQADDQTQNARMEYHHDKREIILYHSDLNDDILKNPALYMGSANF